MTVLSRALDHLRGVEQYVLRPLRAACNEQTLPLALWNIDQVCLVDGSDVLVIGAHRMECVPVHFDFGESVRCVRLAACN